MTTRAVDELRKWDGRQFDGGFDGLHDLAAREFTGAVEAGGGVLFMLRGRVVGVFALDENDDLGPADIDRFEGATGTAYDAPHAGPPLLFAMQATDGEERGRYYTEDTPLAEVHERLSGGFTGYVELSENVLSGDYYSVYHGGRAKHCAYVGQSRRLLEDDEAFDRACDEVGIYTVTAVDLDIVEIPGDPADGAGAGSTAGAAAGAGAATGAGAAASGNTGSDPSDASDESDGVGADEDSLESGIPEVGPDPTDDGPSPTGPAAGALDQETPEGGSDSDREEGDDGALAEETTMAEETTGAVSDPADDLDIEAAVSSVETELDGDATAEETTGSTTATADATSDTADATNDTADATSDTADATNDAADAVDATVADPDEAEIEPDRVGTETEEGAADAERTDGESEAAGAAAGAAASEAADAPDDGAGDTEEPTTGAHGDTAALRGALAAREDEVDRLESEIDRLERELQTAEDDRDDLAARVAELEDRLREVGSGDAAPETSMTPAEAFAGTSIFVRYRSKSDPTLDDLGDGVSREALVGNLTLEHHTEFDADTVSVDGRQFDAFLEGTQQYRFVRWLVTELPLEVRGTGRTKALQELYGILPDIDRVELDGTVDGGKEFDLVARDRMGEPLVVATLSDSREPTGESELAELVQDATAIAQESETLAGAVAVTSAFFEPGALSTTEEVTSGSLLSRDKRESYVKLSRSRGYHLCLVEDREDSFYLSVPEL